MSDFDQSDAEDLKRPGNRNRKPTGQMALTAQEGLPPGPYSVGLTHGPSGDGEPWTVCCGDGRAIAGSVHSKASAEAIVEALTFMDKNQSDLAPAVIDAGASVLLRARCEIWPPETAEDLASRVFLAMSSAH